VSVSDGHGLNAVTKWDLALGTDVTLVRKPILDSPIHLSIPGFIGVTSLTPLVSPTQLVLITPD